MYARVLVSAAAASAECVALGVKKTCVYLVVFLVADNSHFRHCRIGPPLALYGYTEDCRGPAVKKEQLSSTELLKTDVRPS